MGLFPFLLGYKLRRDDVHPCFPCISHHLKEMLGIPLPFYGNRFKLLISLRQAFNFSFLIIFLSNSFFFIFKFPCALSFFLYRSTSSAFRTSCVLCLCFAVFYSFQVRKSFSYFFSYFLEGFGGGF